MIEELLTEIRQRVIDGDPKGAKTAVENALSACVPALQIIDEGLVPGIDEVGRRFHTNEYFLPDLMLGAKAMESGMAVAQAAAIAQGGQPRQTLGTVVLGTVQGDLHEIGKNLVALMLRVNGFEVHDLGVNVPAERFVRVARDCNADIVGLSALLTVTMSKQKEVIEALGAAMLSKRPKVMVGGAPINQEWANRIGADCYSPDATRAVQDAKRLLRIVVPA